MPTAHANHAAAVAAGFKSVATDQGALAPPAERWEVTLEKHTVGGAKRTGSQLRAYGVGSSQANAEARATAALNAQRDFRYGAAAAGGSKNEDGDALSVDVA